MKISVSILIPAYNAARWVADCIKSALQQTWQNKEVIIVDDGSSDRTLAIAKKFESKSVKVVSQHNQGASAARNKALSLAQGDYIQWLDADNLLAPDKIALQLKYEPIVENKRILLSSAWGRFYYRIGKAGFTPTGLWTDLTPLEWTCRKMEQNIYMVPETWLVSRELTERAGGWNEHLSLDDDGEYFCRVIMASRMIKFIPEARSYYRLANPDSLSSVVKMPDNKMESLFSSIRFQIYALLSVEESERTKRCCLRYLQRSLIYFYPEKTAILKEAQKLARALGGTLSVPRLGWKYSVIKNLFGWDIAKKLRFSVSEVKVSMRKHVDRLFYRVSGGPDAQ